MAKGKELTVKQQLAILENAIILGANMEISLHSLTEQQATEYASIFSRALGAKVNEYSYEDSRWLRVKRDNIKFSAFMRVEEGEERA